MLFSLFIKVPILYKISYKNTNLFHQLLCFTHQLLPAGPRPLARSCQNRQASSQLLPARPGTAAHTPRQNRQASRHGGSSFSQGPGKTPFCQNRQASTNSYVSCTRRAREDALLSEQTSKQLSTGYPQSLGKLSTAFAHDSSSTAQEPWSPVHIGSVFSPWTTNDSTWDA